MKHEAELHTLTGAYALDALTGEELRAFTAHLEHCESCHQEVGEFAATAARLAAASSLLAPVAMRQAVLHYIGDVRQMPPRTQIVPSVRLTTLLTRRAGAFVVAASIVAAAGFGGVAVWQHQQAEQARTQAQRAGQQAQDMTTVMASPDARTTRGHTSTGALASVVTSARLNQAVFLTSGLPPAPAGRTYQLWFDDHGTMRPAGLIPGDGSVLMQGDPGQALAVGLTLEPAGGSPQPTTSPLLLLSIPA
ncbi:anti-sigma factor [Streptomyces sp. H34-S4]|uniref:anti-sigma factor n=1 Tax=Streptomyces sp. H34-S4 TaxID=2996463 RepID=UPI00226D9C88|nr:anti-sigma factor [Streptomyces sp. H34-S4]MCY0938096.1 anti-sigma factor [Streptomyces sp. H34-S4]